MELDLIGKWAFIVGLAIAVISAFITSISVSTIMLVLFVLGLIVGFLNVSEKNTIKFLVAVIALFTAGSLGVLAIGQFATTAGYLQEILGNFIVFIAASALVVSIKAIITMSQK